MSAACRSFAEAMTMVPPMQAAWCDLAATLTAAGGAVSTRVKELSGRAVAEFYGGLFTPGLIAGPLEPSDERERLAAEFAQRAARDHVAIEESVFERLAELFSEPERIELWLWVGFIAGANRFGAVLGLAPSSVAELLAGSHRGGIACRG